jgi:dihydrofolate reductase
LKTFLVFVVTADGKVTKWGDPFVRAWSSKEDHEYFSALMKSAPLVVMGSSTFNADPIKPGSGRLMVILTSKPWHYKKLEIPGNLEFTAESPARLVEKYDKMGYREMLVAGGPHVATSFLKEQQINEIWLTIEPRIFGTGGSFVTDSNLDIKLKLLTIERINDQGTLIAKYAVIQ